jgi:hypothetical protein
MRSLMRSALLQQVKYAVFEGSGWKHMPQYKVKLIFMQNMYWFQKLAWYVPNYLKCCIEMSFILI